MRSLLTGALSLVLVTVAAAPAMALKTRHVENFTTTQFKDNANTTAVWDTVSGEIRLAPFALSLLGAYDTPGNAWQVEVYGDYAFVADYQAGLRIIDVTNPANPLPMGVYDDPTPANAPYKLHVSGDHVYVADLNGLQVVDVSDPTAPTLAGAYAPTTSANDVFVAGDYAYLADGSAGLRVIDVSDPTSPSLVTTLDTPNNAIGIAVAGNYAYVADLSSLQVIDIYNPASPSLAGSLSGIGSPVNLALAGDRLYVAALSGGLQVVDISTPSSPSAAGSIATLAVARDVVVDGDVAYVAVEASGLQLIDISNPANPIALDSYDTPGNGRGVAISGGLVYVADDTQGLQIVEVMDAMAPVLGGGYTDVNCKGVVVAGDRAYLTVYAMGLRVLDITDPMNPGLLGTHTKSSIFGANAVAVDGDLAYMSAGGDIEVVDISSPATPALVVLYTGITATSIEDLVVDGDYLYAAASTIGTPPVSLHVIDVSNPAAPALVGTYDPPGAGGTGQLVVAGDRAYMTQTTAGVRVIDISSPAAPALISTIDTFGENAAAYGVAVAGDYAFVSTNLGFKVADIANPATPIVASVATPGLGGGPIALRGDRAFVAGSSYDGLHTIDVSDPLNPTVMATHSSPVNMYDVTVAGARIFTATSDGMKVFDAYSRQFRASSNRAQSIAIDAASNTIARVKLNTAQTDSVGWEASVDGGLNWQAVAPGSDWVNLANPGSDLVWRSTHVLLAGGSNPSCSSLQVDWLYAVPAIDSILDIPGDQGRRVRVSWTRCANDLVGDPAQIIEYAVYREIEPPAPPGTWEYVSTVPARAEDRYAVVVPTVADSTVSGGMVWTSFFVRARTATPGVYIDSPPDSGYSVDNIVPGPPQGFVVAYATGSGNRLTWDPSDAPDFSGFRVYRGETPDFETVPASHVHTTTGTEWQDPDRDDAGVYYKVTVIDAAGNESAPAGNQTPTGTGQPSLPRTFALYQNMPNPFNPTTRIRYDVPTAGGRVTLRVYDVVGRLVRTLVDEAQTPGAKAISWNGRTDAGRRVASGVYFYRLRALGFEKTLKMIVLE